MSPSRRSHSCKAFRQVFGAYQSGSASKSLRILQMRGAPGWPPPAFFTRLAISACSKSNSSSLDTVWSAHTLACDQGDRDPCLPDAHHAGAMVGGSTDGNAYHYLRTKSEAARLQVYNVTPQIWAHSTNNHLRGSSFDLRNQLCKRAARECSTRLSARSARRCQAPWTVSQSAWARLMCAQSYTRRRGAACATSYANALRASALRI